MAYNDESYTAALNSLANQVAEIVIEDCDRLDEFEEAIDEQMAQVILDLNEEIKSNLARRMK